MSEQNSRPVVVAIGHDQVGGALSFAAEEAVRQGCGLHLVHVVHLVAQGPEMALVSETDLERAGRLVLNDAIYRARELAPKGTEVTSQLRIGGVVPTLVEMAKGARMIVLQRRSMSNLMRVVTRSVSSGVAARARIPVVSVPSHWPTGRPAGDTPVVTVGIDVPERSVRVLSAAIAAAHVRGADLRVLHTWSYPVAYDGMVFNEVAREEWEARARSEIDTAVAAQAEAAEVPVRIEVRHITAADALIDASGTSELLVIGRHDPIVPLGSHLGPIARAVLREAECPVMLVDPRER